MEPVLLNDILIIFGLSILVLLIFHKFRVPTIVGFLFTGILAGPHGLGLIDAAQQVERLAEIGIVLLLFTIGIQFSLKELARIKKSIFVGGSLQMGLTILAVALAAGFFGKPLGEAIFLGCLLALSSTAIILKLLEERAEMDSPQGRNGMAISIFQDIIIIPIILFMPILAGEANEFGKTFLWLLAKAVIMLGLVLISAQWVVPKILFQIVKTRSRELFLLSIVIICFAVAGLSSFMGLSLSLGAFLAGLIISESEYSHQALGNILPFQHLFLSLFFVSIGMLLDVTVLFENSLLIFSAVICVILLKAAIGSIAVLFLGFPLRTCIIIGLMISQIGEFSFIFAEVGMDYRLLPEDDFQLFLSLSLLTMAASPFVIAAAPKMGDLISKWPLPGKLKLGWNSVGRLQPERSEDLKDHLIIIGFGINGRNVALAAGAAGISYIIIEMNPETVRAERENGEPIFFGDAGEESVLRHAGIQKGNRNQPPPESRAAHHRPHPLRAGNVAAL
jgi:CPA2 family monovalent cation:H+ antiporter-2